MGAMLVLLKAMLWAIGGTGLTLLLYALTTEPARRFRAWRFKQVLRLRKAARRAHVKRQRVRSNVAWHLAALIHPTNVASDTRPERNRNTNG